MGKKRRSLGNDITLEELEGSLDANQQVENAQFSLDFVYKNLLDSPKITSHPHPEGFRENMRLYQYQLNSIGKMIDRETNVQRFLEPQWQEEYDKQGTRLFKNLATSETTNEVPGFYFDEKGGILCEEMGTGKTAICIGLILYTRGQKAKPEIDGTLRKRNDQIVSPNATLKELCMKHIINTFNYHTMAEKIPEDLQEVLETYPIPSFYQYEVRNRFSNRLPEREPTQILISHATLIIIPPQLLNQWQGEFTKFVEDGFLRILVLAKPDDLVSAEEIARNYDVVIITNTLLQKDIIDSNYVIMNNGYSPKRMPYTIRNSLLRVFWLRVIVDEGHTMALDTTNQTHLASRFMTERVWICTGTPTPKNLTNQIEQELKYLYGLLKFVRQKPWVEYPKLWNSLIVKPLKDRKESASKILLGVLNRVMVRNRQDIIENDVLLPKCSVSIKKLQFKTEEAMRYNQFVSTIRTNLITSRYEGKNSLTHISNRKHTFSAISRLREACFFYQGLSEDERRTSKEAALDDIMGIDQSKTPLSDDERKTLEEIIDLLEVDVTLPPKTEVHEGAKIEYIEQRIRSLPPRSKAIVFTQFNDTLSRLLVHFDKTDIKSVEYHTEVSTSKRASAVVTFNTSENCQVIFMKTELAAYGINLTAANYVFFMEPVWDLTKEAQAIKRAHRIGQTRDVFVEKLVIEGSIEEMMTPDFYDLQRKKQGGAVLEIMNKLLYLLKCDFSCDVRKLINETETILQERRIKEESIPELEEEKPLIKEESNQPTLPTGVISPSVHKGKGKRKVTFEMDMKTDTAPLTGDQAVPPVSELPLSSVDDPLMEELDLQCQAKRLKSEQMYPIVSMLVDV